MIKFNIHIIKKKCLIRISRHFTQYCVVKTIKNILKRSLRKKFYTEYIKSNNQFLIHVFLCFSFHYYLPALISLVGVIRHPHAVRVTGWILRPAVYLTLILFGTVCYSRNHTVEEKNKFNLHCGFKKRCKPRIETYFAWKSRHPYKRLYINTYMF